MCYDVRMLAYMNAPCPTCGTARRVVNGSWLRQRRETAGLTLRACAEQFGVSAPYLSDIERNQRRCTVLLLDKYKKLL